MSDLGLKAAIEKIESMTKEATAQLLEVHEKQYSTQPLYKIEKEYNSPKTVTLNTLESLADIISIELEKANQPLFVNVKSPTNIDVFSTYHEKENCRRDYTYAATAELPYIDLDTFIDHESFMIALRSKFVKNEDVEYLLDLLSKISDKNSVESEDNGLSQTVQARKGVVMVENVTVRPKVKLAPYRTFLEVDQPESEFLVRVKEGGYIGLFEADGGAWKLDAKDRVKSFLKMLLSEEIEADKVVIIA